jgi:hypothetical protein
MSIAGGFRSVLCAPKDTMGQAGQVQSSVGLNTLRATQPRDHTRVAVISKPRMSTAKRPSQTRETIPATKLRPMAVRIALERQSE